MRSKLLQIVRQTALRSEKSNDYNFRVYFVNKYNDKAAKIENIPEAQITLDDIKRAEQ